MRSILAASIAPFLFSSALLAAAPVPSLSTSDSGKGPFLFSYFYGNGDGLHLATSPDGLKFTPLNDDKPFLIPHVGSEKLFRDPCLRQGPDGLYHVVWTTGWHDKAFGAASSKDLLHWSDQQYVEAMKNEPKTLNTWAPELFYDDQKSKGGQWLIFWASTIPGKFPESDASEASNADKVSGNVLNNRFYFVTTKDFATFSDTKLFYDPGFNCIDATITRIDVPTPKYIMVLKDERKVPIRKNLRIATADNPEGPWSKAADPFSIAWVEGPTICKVGDAWNIYYDEYRAKKYGAVRTKDWTTFDIISPQVQLPRGARHGTVIEISPETFTALQSAPLVETK
jgi:hypothetical protein